LQADSRSSELKSFCGPAEGRVFCLVGHCDAGLGWGQVEYAVGGLAEVGPGGAGGVHVDVAPQHAGMLVELAEAVSPSIVGGEACAHVRAARLPARAVAAE
jgi:hypothetical protein